MRDLRFAPTMVLSSLTSELHILTATGRIPACLTWHVVLTKALLDGDHNSGPSKAATLDWQAGIPTRLSHATTILLVEELKNKNVLLYCAGTDVLSTNVMLLVNTPEANQEHLPLARRNSK